MEQETLEKVFSVIFPNVPVREFGTMRRGETYEWDSLKHIELLAELEDHFGIEISEEVASTLGTFDQVVEFIAGLRSE